MRCRIFSTEIQVAGDDFDGEGSSVLPPVGRIMCPGTLLIQYFFQLQHLPRGYYRVYLEYAERAQASLVYPRLFGSNGDRYIENGAGFIALINSYSGLVDAELGQKQIFLPSACSVMSRTTSAGGISPAVIQGPGGGDASDQRTVPAAECCLEFNGPTGRLKRRNPFARSSGSAQMDSS